MSQVMTHTECRVLITEQTGRITHHCPRKPDLKDTNKVESKMEMFLDSLKDEDLLDLFHRKKTEMACMEHPHVFIIQLKDHNFVPEDTYQRLKATSSKDEKEMILYEVLEQVETNLPHLIKPFWRCVLKSHILERYPVLKCLKDNLMDGIFLENLPVRVEGREKIDNDRGENSQWRKKSVEEAQPGPSTEVITSRRSLRKLPSSSPPQSHMKDFSKKDRLPVSCGNKKGILDRHRLAKGCACIEVNGHWLTPTGFEKLGGKESRKNWKLSIHYKGITLQKMIQDGDLKYSKKIQRQHVGNKNVRTRLSSRLITDTHSEEEEKEEDNITSESDDHGAESHNDVDMSEFGGSQLPVTCGSVKGTLHKDRFSKGTPSRCIRTEDKWLSPVDFVKQDPTFPPGSWKKSIFCHGKPLSFLIKEGVLDLHFVFCGCDLCMGKDLENQANDDYCFICGIGGELVCCEECPRAFHAHCHLPAVDDDSLGNSEKWTCMFCLRKKSQRRTCCCPESSTQAQDCHISDSMLENGSCSQHMEDLFDILRECGDISTGVKADCDPFLSCLHPNIPSTSPAPSLLHLLSPTPPEPLTSHQSVEDMQPHISGGGSGANTGSGRLEDFLESTTGTQLIGVESDGPILTDDHFRQMASTSTTRDHPPSPMDTFDINSTPNLQELDFNDTALDSGETGITSLSSHVPLNIFLDHFCRTLCPPE